MHSGVGDQRRGSTEGRRPDLENVGRPKGGGPKVEGGRGENFELFFPLPPFLSLWGSSLVFFSLLGLVVFEGQDPQMSTFGLSGCRLHVFGLNFCMLPQPIAQEIIFMHGLVLSDNVSLFFWQCTSVLQNFSGEFP